MSSLKYINDYLGKNVYTKQIDKALKEQAVYLQELIIKHLKDYRHNFHPKVYKRTGSLEESVEVSSTLKYTNGKISAYVYFNEKALHRSGFGVWAVKDGHGKYDDDIQSFENKKSVNTAYLIDRGYTVKKPVWFQTYENFGYRDGAYFVENAIDEFNKTNKLGIIIDKNSDILTRREW